MEQYDPDAVTRVERETWDGAASIYVDTMAKLTSHALEILIERAEIDGSSKALEVACGPGHFTRMIADTGATTFGVDLSPEMVIVASGLYPDIEFKEANAENIPFDDETFDAVFINFAIHHFARPEKACGEIRRVLKPGARFVFAGPIEQFGFGSFIDALSRFHTLEDLPHGPIYMGATGEDYENLIRESGFTDFDVNVLQLDLVLDTFDQVLETGWKMCGLNEVSKEIQENIRAAAIENAKPYLKDGGYRFPDRVVVGVARKS